MSTQTHTAEPRCSFCGRAVETDGTMVSGPDVHICDRCVREAADMVDADADEATIEQEPTGEDYGHAYDELRTLRAPLLDLLHDAPRVRSVLEVVADNVRWYRAKHDLAPGLAAWMAVKMEVRIVMKLQYRHQ